MVNSVHCNACFIQTDLQCLNRLEFCAFFKDTCLMMDIDGPQGKLSKSIMRGKCCCFPDWWTSVLDLVNSSLLMFCITPLPDPPEWTSAGCYFNSITRQVCCTTPAWTNRIEGNNRLNPNLAVGKVWPAAPIPSIVFIPDWNTWA